MPAPPTIEAPRLILRPLMREDAEPMFALASNDNVARYVSWPTHRTIADTHAFLDFVFGKYDKNTPYTYAITLREQQNAFIGVVGSDEINSHHSLAHWGWWIGEPYWGRGYMTEAARHGIDWQFANTDVNRVEAMAHVDNIGSWRVMEKIGMTYEGTLREYRRFKGELKTVRYYSLLRSEWKNAR